MDWRGAVELKSVELRRRVQMVRSLMDSQRMRREEIQGLGADKFQC